MQDSAACRVYITFHRYQGQSSRVMDATKLTPRQEDYVGTDGHGFSNQLLGLSKLGTGDVEVNLPSMQGRDQHSIYIPAGNVASHFRKADVCRRHEHRQGV